MALPFQPYEGTKVTRSTSTLVWTIRHQVIPATNGKPTFSFGPVERPELFHMTNLPRLSFVCLKSEQHFSIRDTNYITPNIYIEMQPATVVARQASAQLSFSLTIGRSLVPTITQVTSLGYNRMWLRRIQKVQRTMQAWPRRMVINDWHMRHAFVRPQPEHESTVG